MKKNTFVRPLMICGLAVVVLLCGCKDVGQGGTGTVALVWTEHTNLSEDWRAIASSSDGSHLAACYHTGNNPHGGDIFTSTDGGATWTDHPFRSQNGPWYYWTSIASSADGIHLAACADGSNYAVADIFTSTDGGATWTVRTAAGSRDWSCITSSSDGTHLAACVGIYNGPLEVYPIGDIYTSADGGATWTDQTAAGSRVWTSIASSSDGSHLAACVDGGDIFTGHY